MLCALQLAACDLVDIGEAIADDTIARNTTNLSALSLPSVGSEGCDPDGAAVSFFWQPEMASWEIALNWRKVFFAASIRRLLPVRVIDCQQYIHYDVVSH